MTARQIYRKEHQAYYTAYMKKYRQSHPEFRKREIESNKKWRISHSEVYKETNKRQMLRKKKIAQANPGKSYALFYRDPEQHRRYMQTYYSKNREKIFQNAMSWRRKNPERYLVIGRSYMHIRRKNLIKCDKISCNDWETLINRSPMCPMCGRFVECENLTIDHVIPVSRGGYHVLVNLSPLCKSCNSKKQAKMPPLHVIKEIISKGGADPKILEEILCQQMTTIN